MKSFIVDLRESAPFTALRLRMVDLPKLRGGKFPAQLKTERIKTGPDNDHLCRSIDKGRARESGDAFLAQSVMQQNSRNRDALNRLRNRSKPALLNNFQKQTRLWRIRLQHLSAQICRILRDEARMFWIVMQQNQARGNEQRRAASSIVLHAG